MKRPHSIPLLLLLLIAVAAPVSAQQVRGRIVDERTRQAVAGVPVVLLDGEGGVRVDGSTDATGFFILRPATPGTYTLVVIHPGYAEHRQDVTVGTTEKLIPAVVLKTQAVELEGLEVEARSERADDVEPAGFQRSSQIRAGDHMARLERHGAKMITAVRELSTLRVREWMDPNGRTRVCVASLRSAPTGLKIGGTGARGLSAEPCEWVTIVVDGIGFGSGQEEMFRTLQVSDYESVEYLPPAEAGRLYGMDAALTGALVLWSRGRGPHASEERNRRLP